MSAKKTLCQLEGEVYVNVFHVSSVTAYTRGSLVSLTSGLEIAVDLPPAEVIKKIFNFIDEEC